MTDFRISSTLQWASTSTHGILEIDTPLLPVMQLVDHPGTNPTITVPMVDGVDPDLDGIRRYLAEPADFFGIPMPDRDALSTAMMAFARAGAEGSGGGFTAASVLLLAMDGQTQVVVTGRTVRAVRSEAVRIDRCDACVPKLLADEPLWRRMAARTTSMGESDQLRRWLDRRGYVDAIAGEPGAGGTPMLGALVFDTPGGPVGVENPEPTSILDQLQRCGVIDEVAHLQECPIAAGRAWWISPMFETHPVAEIDGTAYRVDTATPPPFSRLR